MYWTTDILELEPILAVVTRQVGSQDEITSIQEVPEPQVDPQVLAGLQVGQGLPLGMLEVAGRLTQIPLPPLSSPDQTTKDIWIWNKKDGSLIAHIRREGEDVSIWV
jgi:hypothetical protein